MDTVAVYFVTFFSWFAVFSFVTLSCILLIRKLFPNEGRGKIESAMILIPLMVTFVVAMVVMEETGPKVQAPVLRVI